MNPRKVLIITYYWPPAGGIGVHRWLQFSKNLPSFGWTPSIFTARDAQYPILDSNLLGKVPQGIEVHRVKVPEPNNLLTLFSNRSSKSKNIYKMQQQSDVDHSLFKKLLWFIRGNFFIPDARKFWIKPSFNYLSKLLATNPVDVIITTGPPHSTHLIGYKLHKEFNIPWISDFRDPWTSMDYLKKMNLSGFAMQKHAQMEKDVILNSNLVLVVGNAIQTEFREKYNVNCSVLHNGFEGELSSKEVSDLDTKFTIVHVGSFLHNRNCNDLWAVLGEMQKADPQFARDLEIKLVGNVADVVLKSLEKYGLNNFLNHIHHVDHNTAKSYQRSAQVLLLPIDRIENPEFVVSGKIFEYLQANRPILLIGPANGDAAGILNECAAGDVCEFDDFGSIKNSVTKFYTKFRNNSNVCNSVNVEQFSYKNLTKRLVALLDDQIKHD
ncbi:MAG: glycosyl transferase family 1 [Bacteroidetes bacterium]|nr:glycosyl transferase family 1 [Bacteroidota bacterium]